MLVGNGNSIRIWEDTWVPELHGFIPTPKNGVDPNGILLVSQLFNSDFSCWDVHKLNWWFENSMVDLILKILFFQLVTKINEHGHAKAQRNCQLSRFIGVVWNQRIIILTPFWNCIWKAKLHERHKMMIWRIVAGCLPTKDKLSRFVDAVDA